MTAPALQRPANLPADADGDSRRRVLRRAAASYVLATDARGTDHLRRGVEARLAAKAEVATGVVLGWGGVRAVGRSTR